MAGELDIEPEKFSHSAYDTPADQLIAIATTTRKPEETQ